MPPGITKLRLSMLELSPHETNPLRRGGPLCPPVSIDTVLPIVDANAVLAGWMHRVCAKTDGRYERIPCDSLLKQIRPYAEVPFVTTMLAIRQVPERLFSSWRRSSSAEIRTIFPSLMTTIFVPVWMAVLRAISDARRSAARALRRSGFFAFDISLLIISFLPIQGGLALDLGYQISPSCPQDVYRLSQSYVFQHRSGGE